MSERESGLHLAQWWRYHNPLAYQKMLGWALDDFRLGRHGSVRFYGELLRRPEFHALTDSGSVVTPYHIDNRMLAPLARMMIQDEPRLASIIRLRYSPELDEIQPGNATPTPRRIEVL